jgi:hypothetical protein
MSLDQKHGVFLRSDLATYVKMQLANSRHSDDRASSWAVAQLRRDASRPPIRTWMPLKLRRPRNRPAMEQAG